MSYSFLEPMMIGFLLAVIVLIIFGTYNLMFKKYKNKRIHGLFILDDSDPNTTRWIIDMKMDPEEIKNMKEIRLKVCKMDEGDV